MEAPETTAKDLRALEHALSGLLEALADPEVSPERLRGSWADCAREEEVLLAHLTACRETQGDQRTELEQLLRNVARLHGLAVQAADRRQDEVADALARARTVLGSLRASRLSGDSGQSCDLAG